MKYLVTGGCGFIGTNLINRILKNKDNEVVVIDNLLVGSKDNLHPRAELVVENITDLSAALGVCKDIDVIIHLAANTGVPVSVKDPMKDCMSNVVGTLNYLEAARFNGVKKFIFASSSAVPGAYDPPYNEKLFIRPISPYGASKGAGESYCHVYNATYGVETIALRFSNVYGAFSMHKQA